MWYFLCNSKYIGFYFDKDGKLLENLRRVIGLYCFWVKIGYRRVTMQQRDKLGKYGKNLGGRNNGLNKGIMVMALKSGSGLYCFRRYLFWCGYKGNREFRGDLV